MNFPKPKIMTNSTAQRQTARSRFSAGKRMAAMTRFFLALLLSSGAVFAQAPLPQELIRHKTFGRFLHPASRQGWIELREEAPYTAREIFAQQPELLGLSSDDEMRLVKTRTDAAGNAHHRFAQFYKGVRIELVEHLVHEKKGKVYLVNGDFVPNLQLNVTPAISPEAAIEAALKAVPAEKYLWENDGKQQHFGKKKNDPNASLYPQPELLIVKRNPSGEKAAANYVLAYRMAVFAEKPRAADYVYIDARTGELIRQRSLEVFCNSGPAETTFNGTQTVSTDYRTETCLYDDNESTQYFSLDDCNPDTEIYSWFSDNGILSNDDYFVCDDDNSWDATGGSTQMTISSLWAVKQAYRYYYNIRGHESFDGSDGLIDVFSNRLFYDDNDDEYCGNASFTNIIDNINFGSGDDCYPGSTDDFNTLDIAGHEYTHGVIEYAHFDALDYSDESGALNESFADIFGEIVEEYVEGSIDYLNGGDKSDGYLRSFQDPKSNPSPDPDTYLGTHWYSGDNDNGGVHTNSSVQNHMFYLLAEGGEGVNDHGWEYQVTGIGFEDAADIAWQAMMQYLDGDDGYVTARNAWIQSAKDLFGSCSQEVISVGEAWQAAGVTHYTSYNLASLCGTYNSAFPVFIDAAQEIRNASILFNNFFITCTTNVNAPAIVSLESGYEINLLPGFTATGGSVFTATIDECESSDYDPDDVRLEEQSPHLISIPKAEVQSALFLFPNPSDDLINVEFAVEGDEVISAEIISTSGSVISLAVDAELLAGGKFKTQVNTRDFPSGIYVCRVKSGAQVYTKKFTVQH
jgi:Zn-dependent metalloprotease